MGWMRTLFLGDIGNRLDIEDTERDIRELRSKLRRKSSRDGAQDERIAALELEVRQLELCVGSLTRLLVAKGALSRAELDAIVSGIDGDDPPKGSS